MFWSNKLNFSINLFETALGNYNDEQFKLDIFNPYEQMDTSKYISIYNIDELDKDLGVRINDFIHPYMSQIEYKENHEIVNCHQYIDDVMKIKQYKVKMVKYNTVDFIKNLLETQKETMLGILARVNGIFYNITHPLILIEFLYGNARIDDIEFLVIYNYPQDYLQYDIKLDKDEKVKKYTEQIKRLLVLVYASLQKRFYNVNEVKKNMYKYMLKIKEGKLNISAIDDRDDGLNNATKFIFPVDKMATVYFIPYYGYNYLEVKKGDFVGQSIINYVNQSANLSTVNYDSKNFGHYCTGRNPRNIVGLDSLKVANLASPYNTYCIDHKNNKAWIEANLDVCLHLLNQKLGESNDNRDTE